MPGVLDFVPLFPTQNEDAIYVRLAEWANEGLAPGDQRWVDSREGSIFWTVGRPFARELATFYDRAGTEVPAAAHPLYAWATYLDDLAEIYGLERLPATAAGGTVRFFGAGGELLASGTTVGVPPAGEDTPQPTFVVDSGGTIPAAVAAPAGLAVAAASTGGTFLAGTYFWVITALGGAGETLASNQATVAIVANGRADLTWTAVAGATGYRVYRSTATGVQGVTPAFVAQVGTVVAYSDTGTATMAGAKPAANTTASIDLAVTATDPGVEGNVSAGAVTETVTPLASTVTLTNPTPIVGGTETQTDDALRARFLDAFSPGGSGTRADYKRWALARPGVGRATVIPVWNGAGTVKIVVSTATGQPVAASVVTALQAYFDPTPGLGAGAAPIGHIVTVVTAAALGVTIAATLTLDSAYTLDGTTGTVALRLALEDALRRYLDSVEPGAQIVIAQVIGRLIEVAGVRDVTGVTINGAAANLTVSASPAQVPNLTAFTPTVA